MEQRQLAIKPFHLASWAALFALFGSTCAAACPDVAHENALLSSARVLSAGDNVAGLQAGETEALSAADGSADRDGGRLTFHTRSGVAKSYDDRPGCSPSADDSACQTYRLIAYACSRGVFVTARLFYEHVEYLLIDDATGAETTLRGFPIFSPSGNHVLVLLMNDEELGFAVQIWRRQGSTFVLDWQGSPAAEGLYTSYTLVDWASEHEIDIRSETNFGQSRPLVIKTISLRQAPRGWDFEIRPL